MTPTNKNSNGLLRAVTCAGLSVPIVFLAACAGAHITTDYNHSANFAQIHTYSWLKVQASNQLWDNRIRRDVDQQLKEKGWTEVPSGGQAAIAAFGATHEQKSLQTFYDGFGPGYGGWYWGGWGMGGMDMGYSTTQPVYTPVGTLVVDIFNDNSKHLIWRGIARQVISGNPQENRPKLEQAVTKLFRNFPPTQG